MSFAFSVSEMLKFALLALSLSGSALAQNATVSSGTTASTTASVSSSSSSSLSDEPTTTVRRTLTSTTLTTVTPSPSITPGANCTLSCYIGAIRTKWDWLPQPFTTTITAATKIIIINDDTNTTRTSLIFNDLPSGYTLPPMNEEGTQIWSISYTLPGETTPTTTTLTFPTAFVQWPLGYTWSGNFPTTGVSGQPSCLTNDGATTYPYPSYTTSPQPTLRESLIGNNGLGWSTWLEKYPEKAYTDLLPDDPILNGCNLASGVAPVGANPTASFLTEVTTSHESGAGATNPPAPAPAPEPADPAPAPAPAPEPAEPAPAPAPAPEPANPAPAPAPAPAPEPADPQVPTPQPVAPAPAPGNTQVPAPEPAVPIAAPGGTQAPVPPPAGTATQLPQVTGTNVANNPPPAQGTTPGIQTVVGGQPTGAPAATNVPAPAPAPPIVVVGETFTPITTASAAAPVFNVGGQTLGVGSTIILTSGSVSETVALQTNNAGSTVLVVGSSSSTLPPPPPATTPGIGDAIAGGLGESSTRSSSTASSSGPALQTTNLASRNMPGYLMSLAASVMFAIAWR